MAYEDYFFRPDFQNTALFREMLQYLVASIQNMAREERATIPGCELSYESFLKDGRIPRKGKPWQTVFDAFLQLFQRAVVWQSPHAMINITPPPNIPSVLGASFSALFNPNFGTDESAGLLAATEMYVIRNLADLAGWEPLEAGGIFTFGGKGTVLYACKTGLRKAFPDSDETGISAGECLVFTNSKAHPCHREASAWLGIGKRQVVTLPVTRGGTVCLREFERQLDKALAEHKKVACIFLNGGTTNEGYIDPIRQVVEIRNRLTEKYRLDYYPHIHVDAVIGWVWLLFKDYDYEINPLHMTDAEKNRIRDICRKSAEIIFADSFGADFHKTGFCPYVSSVYMVKKSAWLVPKRGFAGLSHGEYAPFEYSLELSRSANGPVAAYLAMELLGVEGLQKLIYQVFHAGECIREAIAADRGFILLNPDTYGFPTLFLAIPPHLLCERPEDILSNVENYPALEDYNHQFYMYLEQSYEQGRLNTRITFSKSYRPYGSSQKLGALKSFPMSPIADDQQWKECIREIISQKEPFDRSGVRYTDDRRRAEDLVWRS